MRVEKSQEWLRTNETQMIDVAEKIWQLAEVAFHEHQSSKILVDILKKNGFTVVEQYAGIPTAFRASYGTGKLKIGLLAEYDALPGLSQEVGTMIKSIENQDSGHGCGHNLMAVTCLASALAIKESMESLDECTIVLYGCPAEELLVGKGFMAREGAFKELDLAIAWHPGIRNMTIATPWTALESGEFFFTGRSAHAAGDPFNGRSALDAVEIMDIGANYLREHVRDDVRLHYQITYGGGAPNIVPEKASVLYYVRANSRERTMDTFERVKKCADGSSIMTETSYELVNKGGCYELLINEPLVKAMDYAMSITEKPVYTQKELDFADELNKQNKNYAKISKKQSYQSIFDDIKGIVRTPMGGSTDVGDVSHIVPLVLFMTATQNSLAPGHSWQVTACSGSSIGYKGMFFASRIIVNFVDHVLSNPEIVINAKREFDEEISGRDYICPIHKNMSIEDFA